MFEGSRNVDIDRSNLYNVGRDVNMTIGVYCSLATINIVH
jgi:hypothetical protein